jgi:integrase
MRAIWERHEIEALFSSPLYTGSRSSIERHLPGPAVTRDALYWVPLILAYTRMRREEICQLQVRHLRYDDHSGIWYFDLTGDDLQLHHSARRRCIPLPDALLELKLIEFLRHDREMHELLFADHRCSVCGKYGDKLGLQFRRYCELVDGYRLKAGERLSASLYGKSRGLQSFRDHFCLELVDRGVVEGDLAELLGIENAARRRFPVLEKSRALELLKREVDKRNLPIDVPRLAAVPSNSRRTH